MPFRQVMALEVISDATANLATHVMAAVLTQFDRTQFEMRAHRFINTVKAVDDLVSNLIEVPTIVVHAVVEPALKQRIAEKCDARKIPHFDITQSLVSFLSEHSGQEPKNERARLHRTDKEYFRRIEAMEFTAQHDDARRLESAREADIVLVGLSRVSKSPTSTYLGSMGFKVANIPLSPRHDVPAILDEVAEKVVALTIQPKKLQKIRSSRFQQFNEKIADTGASELPYAQLRSIIREVMWAESLYLDKGFKMIDTTYLTVEQTAARILVTLKLKRRYGS